MRRDAGFSLTELMTVVLIFGMVAAFSVPAFNKSMTGWRLQEGHSLLISELKLTRQRAISEGRNRRMWFSPGSRLYWFQNPETFIWTAYLTPNRTIIESVNFPGGPFDTYMMPNGRALRAGQIVLRNDAGKRDTIQVDLSGYVGRP